MCVLCKCANLTPKNDLDVAILAPKCYILKMIEYYLVMEVQSMAISKQNQRVSARVPTHVYQMLAQAAELTGATLNQFLVQSAFEKAQKVIEHEWFIKMTVRSASAFFDALENPPEPNEKLSNAIRAYKSSFDGAQN